MKGLFRKILIVPALFIPLLLVGQADRYKLSLYENSQLTCEKSWRDSVDLNVFLSEKLQDAKDAGYFMAGYDSVNYDGNLVKAYYSRRELFEWGNVRIFCPENVLDESYWQELILSNQPSPRLLVDVMSLIQKELLNDGFADVVVSTKEIIPQNNTLSWELEVKPGQRYIIDEFILDPDMDFPPEIIYYRYDIFPGNAFSMEKIRSLSEGKLNPEWLISDEAVELDLKDSICTVRLSYKMKKQNQLNAMLGIVPGNETDNLYLTGDFQLKLFNAFKQAEGIGFEWRSYQPGSQDLLVSYSQPVIIGAWGLGGNFNLQKQDSSYVNLHGRLGVNRIQYASEFNLFLEWFQSGVIQESHMDGDLSSASHRKLGLSYERMSFDYPQNPKSGYRVYGVSTAGIRSEDNLEDMSDFIFDAEAGLEFYLPLQKRLSLNLDVRAACRYTDALLSLNEMYRLGGMKNLRGYPELSIYTDAWYLFSLETLFFPDRESAFYLFGDAAYVNDSDLITEFIPNMYWSIGAGMKLNTNLGQFQLSFAIPRSSSSKLDYRISKIHLGYVNYF